MNFFTKIKLNMKRKSLIKAQEELKLLKILAEKTKEEEHIKKQINEMKPKKSFEDDEMTTIVGHTITKPPKPKKQSESEFIQMEYPNYAEEKK